MLHTAEWARNGISCSLIFQLKWTISSFSWRTLLFMEANTEDAFHMNPEGKGDLFTCPSVTPPICPTVRFIQGRGSTILVHRISSQTSQSLHWHILLSSKAVSISPACPAQKTWCSSFAQFFLEENTKAFHSWYLLVVQSWESFIFSL